MGRWCLFSLDLFWVFVVVCDGLAFGAFVVSPLCGCAGVFACGRVGFGVDLEVLFDDLMD